MKKKPKLIFLFVSLQMLVFFHLTFFFLVSSSLAKITYCKPMNPLSPSHPFPFILVNLENIYGPYCNAENTYTPDAGVVRYAG